MRTNAILALTALTSLSLSCGTTPSGPAAATGTDTATDTSTGASTGTQTSISTGTDTSVKTETASTSDKERAEKEKADKEAKEKADKAPAATASPASAPEVSLTLDQKTLTFADVVRAVGSDTKTVNLTAGADLSDLVVTVTSGSATSTSAGPFSATTTCSSLKKGESCSVSIKAAGTTIGAASGTLSISTKDGKSLGSVALAVDVTMLGVKKMVPKSGFGVGGVGYIFNDGTAKFWGELEQETRMSTPTRVVPNPEYRASLSSAALSSSGRIYVQALPVVLPDNAKVVDMAWPGLLGCAIDDRERLVCWGMVKSQTVSTATSIALVPEVFATGAKSMGMAGGMVCYLDSNSKAWCLGQVTVGTNSPGYTDVVIAGSALTLTPRSWAPSYSFDYLTVAAASIMCGKVKDQEKVVCSGSVQKAFGTAGNYTPFELSPTQYAISGPIRNVQASNDSVCIQSDILGCTGADGQIGAGGSITSAVYAGNFQPRDKLGNKVAPMTIWAQMTSYCAKEASGRVLCWGAPVRSSFNDPGVNGQALVPTEQALDADRYPLAASGGKAVAQVGKFDIKSTLASYNADNLWGITGYTNITSDDPVICYTRTSNNCNL